jgi:anti-sigma B factor antagonist
MDYRLHYQYSVMRAAELERRAAVQRLAHEAAADSDGHRQSLWPRLRGARTQPASGPRVREEGVLIVRVEQDGDALVVRASGEVNLTNAKTLEAELRRAIDGDASAVVLDLDGVGFIDTVGLKVLLLIAKQARRNGVLLSRLRGSPPVERLIEKSGVERLLALVD